MEHVLAVKCTLVQLLHYLDPLNWVALGLLLCKERYGEEECERRKGERGGRGRKEGRERREKGRKRGDGEKERRRMRRMWGHRGRGCSGKGSRSIDVMGECEERYT